MLSDLYRPSLAMLTDLYQLTMAYAYWKCQIADQEAVFHLHFRHTPFEAGFAVAAGLDPVLSYLDGFGFDADSLAYLATLEGDDGKPLFAQAFLEHLGAMKLQVDIDAVAEGTVVFSHAPLMRVQGPLVQCQLLETALLNLVGFPTLIATKAARICQAAGDDPVLEFGLRRAQGVDGAISVSRAAYIGGCAGTSNVLAGQLFGIPVRGTHAHSWVMAFSDELEAFEAYADALPNNCILLVDTYDTLNGVRNAIEVGRRIEARGGRLAGIRLDSGDLAWLSIEARKLLDAAGFKDAIIVASNDLDEHIISSVKAQGGQINAWGVGTRLATAYDQPALGCVYKLGALRDTGGGWQYKLKLSEQSVKVSTPGVLQVRRFASVDRFVADAIYDESHGVPSSWQIIDPGDPNRHRTIEPDLAGEDLLQPVVRRGQRVAASPPLETIRARTRQQVAWLHPTIRRLVNPHGYPVGLEASLHDRKTELIQQARQQAQQGSD